jgi:hypothetical protein
MKVSRFNRVLLWVTALLLMIAAVARAADQAPVAATQAAAWSAVDEEWLIFEIAGGRAGWSSNLVEKSADQYRTTTATQIKMNRGPIAVEIRMDTVFIETMDGEPVSLQFVQKTGSQAIDTMWEFHDDQVRQTSRIGGRETVVEKDAPTGDWLTPYKAQQFEESQRAAGIETFTYKTLDPENGVTLVTVTTRRDGETEYETGGKKVPVQIWKTITDIMPVESIEYVDADGDAVYHETPTGIGKIVMRRVTKEEALAGVDGQVPELMLRTFITPDKPIDDSMTATTATLKLKAREGTLPEIPSAGAQRVTMADDRKTATLVIDINDHLPATSGEIASDEFTTPSTMVDFQDSLIAKLSASAAKDAMTAADKADALRRAAHKRISKKGMATAFACASETARTNTGDCSEHGVLLCAMLRAQGIPARVAMGLVYVDQFMGENGIFGWHMWTQALIDGQWVDLDATLPVRYNAAHVLTNTSSLSDGLGAADMASILQLIGNVDIEVIDVGYGDN